MYTWADGRKYLGEYFNDLKHGYGMFIWPDGRSYKGMWLKGKMHGKGVFITSKGIEKYGSYLHGKRIRNIEKAAGEYEKSKKNKVP